MSAPLAISLGDPAGIGPELIAEAWARRQAENLPPFLCVGGAGVLREAAASRGLDVVVQVIERPEDAGVVFAGALPVYGHKDVAWQPGDPNAEGARLAHDSLAGATALAVDRRASGVVTAPVAKSQLASIGFAFPGQTEFVAQASQVEAADAVMMLAGPSLRTVPVTIHCALAEVPRLLTKDLILRRCRTTARALREDFGIASPSLALTGLNPHAGEDGRMGREEIDTIIPAIETLRAEGIDASGPHPADALFAPRARETYDVAIAMYHDQALVPLKALDFDNGVNVTLGLPIVRTSPDHGTAFPIAGKNMAHPGAMIAAIRMAGEMAARRAG